jgi:hypothetical protein
MVGLEGFEPPTHGLGNRCSILLSYRPTSSCASSLSSTIFSKVNTATPTVSTADAAKPEVAGKASRHRSPARGGPLSGRFSAQIVLHDLPVFHHEADSFERADVLQRVVAHGDDVRELAGLETSHAV